MSLLRKFLLSCCLITLCYGQQKGAEPKEQSDPNSSQSTAPNKTTKEVVITPTTIEILERFHTQIQELQGTLKTTKSPEEREQLEITIDRLSSEFSQLLAGKESVAFFNQNITETSLQEELIEIFDPLIGEIKSATSESREKEALRSQIELLTQRQNAIQSALDRIRDNTAEADELSPGLKKALEQKTKLWSDRLAVTELELSGAEKQLTDKEAGSRNAVESASKVVAKFFRTRGLHLLLAITFAVLAWFLVNLGHKYFIRVSPFHQNDHLYSTAKTIDGAVHIGAIFLSILTVILTFFLCDDWVLLSATLLVVVGIFWALRDKLPDIAEEVRLILNVGSVREGERIIFNGLSWKVDRIRVYSTLVNHELEGGVVRIPLNAIIGLHSRPCRDSERYFPTSLNDWVLLSDQTFGKVLHQTPEHVELIQLGGSRKTYTTVDFLALAPENLSRTSFRITSAFGIDYKYQDQITSEIPKTFQTEIEAGIRDFLEDETDLRRLKVEFASAAASSLDFAILADFSSNAAPKYNELTRLVQNLAVQVCNKHGWEIPFTQITLHQA